MSRQEASRKFGMSTPIEIPLNWFGEAIKKVVQLAFINIKQAGAIVNLKLRR